MSVSAEDRRTDSRLQGDQSNMPNSAETRHRYGRGDVKAVHQIKWHKTRIIGFIVRLFHKRTLKFDCHFAS